MKDNTVLIELGYIEYDEYVDNVHADCDRLFYSLNNKY